MNYKILLVEDEKTTGEILKKAVSGERIDSQGIDVTLVEDGKSALAELAPGKFDLIVLDLKLPHMTGDEVLAELRKVDPYVDVIVYSNYEQPQVMQKLINLGIVGYIKKGGEADLWGMVAQIKSRLSPVTDVEREALLQKSGIE